VGKFIVMRALFTRFRKKCHYNNDINEISKIQLLLPRSEGGWVKNAGPRGGQENPESGTKARWRTKGSWIKEGRVGSQGGGLPEEERRAHPVKVGHRPQVRPGPRLGPV
jgi:hypothetical protein